MAETATLNLRLRKTTIAAIMATATKNAITQKQVICRALNKVGVPIDPADLEDRTPSRNWENYLPQEKEPL